MKHIYTLFSLFTLIAFNTNAQEFIQAKIRDSISQKPIPFATISTTKDTGVISNTNGDFLMYLNKKQSKRDSLFVRCLGYETKRFLIKTFSDSLVLLSPKSIELDEVLVSNKNYSVEEIIEKAQENLDRNYDFNFIKSRLFYRASNFTNIFKNEVVIKKTTIPEFNQQFIDSVLLAMPKNSDDYTEILADIYGKSGIKDSQKLEVIKASHLYDKSKEVSFEGYEEKFNKIIKKHVKRDSYFKIKSGIFGTKESIDSSFFENEKQKDVEQTEALIEKKKKQEAERKKNFLKYRKSSISKLQRNSFIFEDSDLNFLEKPNRYDFKIEDYSFLNDNFVYKISFTPKRKADFKGTIYVNTDDFAIVRVDYENVKALKTFKLLGLSYNLNLKRGTLIYAKNNVDKYVLKYADVEEGSKFGIKRPLAIIEKNKHTRGRRKQNQLSSDIHFILSNRQKNELVIFENTPITELEFANFTEKPKIKPIYLPKYDPEFWKGYNVIEPNQAIKDFKSIE
ncbi:MAG: carboxypeptidase-like regulatory domain-containing protein [Algibacter sp.]